MALPLTDESSLRWALICFEFLIGGALLYNSKNQPFPQPSSRFGWLLIMLALLILIGQAAPKPMGSNAHFVMLSALGGFGLVAGVYHLARTQRDVLVAPYAGLLFCVGVVGLMVETWSDLSTLEQWAAFLTLVVIGGGGNLAHLQRTPHWKATSGMVAGRYDCSHAGENNWSTRSNFVF